MSFDYTTEQQNKNCFKTPSQNWEQTHKTHSVPMEEVERTKIRNSGSQLVLMRHRDVLLM